MFCIVNLLTRLPFQLKAPNDGDDPVMIAGAKGGPSKIEEIIEDQIQVESPQEDIEADAYAERVEM
jgi:hypothetical protein